MRQNIGYNAAAKQIQPNSHSTTTKIVSNYQMKNSTAIAEGDYVVSLRSSSQQLPGKRVKCNQLQP